MALGDKLVNLDDLKPGECRDLTKKEINDLLKLCE